MYSSSLKKKQAGVRKTRILHALEERIEKNKKKHTGTVGNKIVEGGDNRQHKKNTWYHTAQETVLWKTPVKQDRLCTYSGGGSYKGPTKF